MSLSFTAEPADAKAPQPSKSALTPQQWGATLADAPPPAAMSMFTQPGRISSMTWMAEFLTETITTDARWFLARHTAQTVRNGYSSQQMLMWNRAGEPVMIGRQTIAVFV